MEPEPYPKKKISGAGAEEKWLGSATQYMTIFIVCDIPVFAENVQSAIRLSGIFKLIFLTRSFWLSPDGWSVWSFFLPPPPTSEPLVDFFVVFTGCWCCCLPEREEEEENIHIKTLVVLSSLASPLPDLCWHIVESKKNILVDNKCSTWPLHGLHRRPMFLMLASTSSRL